ncbi:exported hypothetical protein [Paraburkholderia ribeironis]|uniref:Uncharacterized protein n=1 Tax=Paraburkholderia ribeironis TaxID=1247936 RepID=A0A1N7SDT7_9BURK|nr:hypothetical protein [Paraburkholderia ribeironis]SIT45521.1 exported hypothetical protein [Paraburkholderia ribeironis]
MMDFLVQLTVALVLLAAVVLTAARPERRDSLHERMLHAGTRRHWWNRH